MNANIIIGNKYFKQDDDGNIIDMVRVYRYDMVDTVHTYDEDTKANYRTFSLTDLNDNWILLKPHATIVFCIAKCGNDLEDVIICMHKYKDILAGDNEPYCVLRQNITDLFANIVITSSKTYTGCCVSKDTIPEGVDYNIMTACNSVDKNVFISTYMDDTLDDILSLIKTKPFDVTLESLFTDHINYEYSKPGFGFAKKILKQKDSYDGYCKSLRTLMEENNFMYDFYQAFGIIPVDFEIYIHEDGAICEEAVEVIESVKMVNIIATIGVKYWYDIDFNSIQNDYCLLIDCKANLYVIGYRYSGRKHINLEATESEENIKMLASDPVSKNNDSVKRAFEKIALNKSKYSNK